MGQFDGLSIGDRVTFHMQVKKGQPQACDLLAVPGSMPAGRSQRKSSSNLAGLDPDELDRKLFRACASARVESVDSMEELLVAGANPNGFDLTGQLPLIIAALNVRH